LNWGCLTDNSGERLNGIQEVSGSIPLISTKNLEIQVVSRFFFVFGMKWCALEFWCIFSNSRTQVIALYVDL